MAQLHRLAHGDTSKSPASTIATVEQLLRGGEASKKAAAASSSPSSSLVSNERLKNRGGEASKAAASSASSSSSSSIFNERSKNRETEDHSPLQKKSVLSKVKEKAKKWRHSLSKKKHEDNSMPSLGEEEDEDSEYLGAPMYESEQAPEACKEKARQHPRASPVVLEKHVLSSSVKTGVERDKETPLSPSKSKRIMAHPPATTTYHPAGPSKTMSDNTNKAAPSSSKSKNLSVSKPTELQVSLEPSTSRKASSALSSPKAPRTKRASSQTFYDASMPPHASSAPVTPRGGDKSSSRSDLIWDKGISVREYLKNMFEPGEEERALSEVISEVMSPRKTPQDKGVMEKVQDAVTSLLLNDEPSQHAVHSLSTSSEIPIPVSTNAHEVGREESQGRILQTN